MGDLADEYDWVDYISPEEIDDVNPDEPGTAYGFFQTMIDKFATYQPPLKPMTTERIADMFGVPAEYVGKASDHATDPVMDIQVMTSKHMPKDTSYVFSVDPATPERGMVLMVDEASQILDSRRPHSDHVHVSFLKDSASQRKLLNIDKLRHLFPWAQYPTSVPQINNPKEKYTMDMAGIAAARRELEDMLAKVTSMVAIVERFGGEPGEGTVIKFEHSFETGEDAKVYDYAAVRKFGKWYVTGRPFAGQAISWSKLLEFIGDGRAWVCREFEEVPMPGASVAADGDLKAAFASVLANSGGRDTSEVAEELLGLLGKKD